MSNTATMDRLSFNIAEASSLTGVNRRTLEMLCKTNKLKAKKVGKRWIIDAVALRNLILGENNG